MANNHASLYTGGIKPHGGNLIDRQLRGNEREAASERARGLPQIPLSPVSASDLKMIAMGAYSPLTGFMGWNDYKCVVEEMRLANGLVWPVPVTLPVDDEVADRVQVGQEVALVQEQCPIAIMEVVEKYRCSKEQEAVSVYSTTDIRHPDVAHLYRQGNILLAGEIRLLKPPSLEAAINIYGETPAQCRYLFAHWEWNTVAGFQTRNPLHRAHECILEHALERVDGLFLHPLVGATKSDDVPVAMRFQSYRAILNHFPAKRVWLSAFPAAMRYAGPREAVFHALCRKNYGCTHFIVGRNHAGVGNYYKPLDAQKVFEQFHPAEIGITPLFFNPYFCRECNRIFHERACSHNYAHYDVSGTEIRSSLKHGKRPAIELMRPEVSAVLMDAFIKDQQGDSSVENNILDYKAPFSENSKNRLLEGLLGPADTSLRLLRRHLLWGDIKPGPVSISEVLALETNQSHSSRTMNHRGS